MANKNSKLLFLFFLIGSVFSSCIPTKRITYVEESSQDQIVVESSDWEYKIKSGDRFYIKITDPLSNIKLGSSDVSTNQAEGTMNQVNQLPSILDYLVSDSGMIDYPVLGKIEAEGKTINELIQHLEKECEGYISNPSIRLYMTNYNVTVLGEARNPGFYQLITHKPTFFDAVGLAGDLTDFADRNKIKIIRREDGNQVSVNYIDVMNPQFINSSFYYVHPNDVIHVKPLKVKKFSDNNALPLILSVITTIITVVSITSR